PLRSKRGLARVVLYAASVALFVLGAAYVYYSVLENAKKTQETLLSAIAPGRDQASLSMENGAVFDLDSLNEGEIFQDGGIRIEKGEDGALVYSALDEPSQHPGDVLMNTVTTPRGGQYKIVLPDGTNV